MEAASSPTGPPPGLASPSCTKAGRGEAAPPSLAPVQVGALDFTPKLRAYLWGLTPIPCPDSGPPVRGDRERCRCRLSPPEGAPRLQEDGGERPVARHLPGEAVAERSGHLQKADGSLHLQGWWRVTGNPRPGSQLSPAPLPAPFPLVEGLVWRHWPAPPPSLAPTLEQRHWVWEDWGHDDVMELWHK